MGKGSDKGLVWGGEKENDRKGLADESARYRKGLQLVDKEIKKKKTKKWGLWRRRFVEKQETLRTRDKKGTEENEKGGGRDTIQKKGVPYW